MTAGKISVSRFVYRVFRLEYLFGLVIGCAATLVLWYRPPQSPRFSTAVIAFAYAGILYFSGFLANALGDRDLELAYRGPKQEIALAVKSVGAHSLYGWLGLMLVLGLALGGWLGWRIRSLVPLELGVVGILAGVGYSLPPFRWKVRGFLCHAVTLAFSAFFFPVFLLGSVLSGRFTAELGLLGLGYALAHYAMEIGNQLKDYDDDQRVGIMTLPSTSLPVSSGVGLLLLGVGLVTELAAFSLIFALSLWEALAIGAILFVSHAEICATYARAVRQPEQMLPAFRDLNYARWQTLAMIGYLGAALLIRLSAGG